METSPPVPAPSRGTGLKAAVVAVLLIVAAAAIHRSFVWVPPEPEGAFALASETIPGLLPTETVRLTRGSDVVVEGGNLHVQYGERPNRVLPWTKDPAAPGPGRVALSGVLPGVSARAFFALEEKPVALTIDVEIEYTEKVQVRHENLVLLLPGRGAEGFTREGSLERFHGPFAFTRLVKPYVYFAGRGRTTVRLEGEADAEVIHVKPDPGGAFVVFGLDDEQAHPFPVFAEAEEGGSGGIGFDLSASRMGPGDRRKWRVRLALGGRPAMLRQTLHADGAEAAMILTDYCNDADASRMRATYFGTSDEKDPAHGTKGVLGRGVRASRTFYKDQFDKDRPGGEDFLALARALVEKGCEIGPHSITAGDDTGKVKEGLEFFRKEFKSRFWIDNGASRGPGNKPANNNEALSVKGWDPENKSYIVKALREAGIDYAWNYLNHYHPEYPPVYNLLYPDASAFTSEDLRTPRNEIPLLMMYNNNIDDDPADGRRLHTFPSYFDDGAPRGRTGRLYGKAVIDQLLRERGVHVGHDFFGSSRVEAYCRKEGETFVVDPNFDEAMAAIGRLVKEGRMWNPVVSEWGDFLTRDLPRVKVRRLDDRRFEVSASGDSPVRGATFALRGADVGQAKVKTAAGGPPSTLKTRRVGEGKNRDLYLWMDLAPGEKVEVEAP